MYLILDDQVHDFDLRLLSDLLRIIDQQLDHFEKQVNGRGEEADMNGEFDWMEHVTGLGFVSCQTYLAATYPFTRVTKTEALDLGPLEPKSDRPVVSLINAAANFWKHNPEWRLKPEARRVKLIQEAFDDVGYSTNESYPLCGILNELSSGVARFGVVIPLLEQWRDSLIRTEAELT